MSIAAALGLVCALATSTPGVETVAALQATLAQTSPRSVGEPRYMAVSKLIAGAHGGFVQVLDLDDREVIRVEVELPGRPYGELVSYRPDRVGVLVRDGGLGRESSRYVEVAPASKTATRSVELGPYNVAGLQFLGTDPVTDVAWFAVVRNHPQRPEMRQLVLRSLNLQTLSITDHVQVPMRRRTSKSGYESWLEFHPSADFTRFAAVEYAEDGIEMDPAKVWVIDVERFSWFDIEAPSTAYAAVFSADLAYLYLASNERGTIERVDLERQRVDKKVFGLKAAHHLGISPDSGRLYAVGSSAYHASFELPDLAGRRTGAFVPPVRHPMRYLFGGGAMATDGRFFVVEGDFPEALEPRALFIVRLR